jgi:hypothetical protein
MGTSIQIWAQGFCSIFGRTYNSLFTILVKYIPIHMTIPEIKEPFMIMLYFNLEKSIHKQSILLLFHCDDRTSFTFDIVPT